MYLLSVIIPVYNASSWLGECMSSILDSLQNASDVQIVLIDDGSTDCSGTMCDEYAAQYPFVEVVHKPNGGVASARNSGLEIAVGQFISWIDPDDYVHPSWFPKISPILRKENPDILVFDTMRFDEYHTSPEIYGRDSGWIPRKTFISDVFRDIRMLSGLTNKIIRTALLAGIRFNTALPILEDFHAMPRILEQIQTVYYLPECLYYYRQHSESLLHHVTPNRAFLSVEIARQRVCDVSEEYRAAADTAAAIQALAFCTNQRNCQDFSADTAQLHSCRRYILTKLPLLFLDRDVPLRQKIKFFLAAFGLY